MKNRRFTFTRDQRGVTAIETAIILIAFVVVAAVFAFTVLSSGMNSTEKAKSAIAAGLGEVQSSMEVRGAVLALDTDADLALDEIVFTVMTAAGSETVDLADTTGTPVISIEYRDDTQRVPITDWTVNFLVEVGTTNTMLEPREQAEITVPLGDLTTPLEANGKFVIELKPPTGGILMLERTCPPAINPVNDLN